ncbi:hypothetical protein EW146_g10217 [Bondarzewia mesenterica]|uniref:Uncharacterized protein n=1 Tax=Bondarzewia mesenterica TaxID=1095465 RepID=A0A4S4KZB0_9AGAM|nr:hypothetical protein EW146_g10217 [Bondarzewia mesenterica]
MPRAYRLRAKSTLVRSTHTEDFITDTIVDPTVIAETTNERASSVSLPPSSSLAFRKYGKDDAAFGSSCTARHGEKLSTYPLDASKLRSYKDAARGLSPSLPNFGDGNGPIPPSPALSTRRNTLLKIPGTNVRLGDLGNLNVKGLDDVLKGVGNKIQGVGEFVHNAPNDGGPNPSGQNGGFHPGGHASDGHLGGNGQHKNGQGGGGQDSGQQTGGGDGGTTTPSSVGTTQSGVELRLRASVELRVRAAKGQLV